MAEEFFKIRQFVYLFLITYLSLIIPESLII